MAPVLFLNFFDETGLNKLIPLGVNKSSIMWLIAPKNTAKKECSIFKFIEELIVIPAETRTKKGNNNFLFNTMNPKITDVSIRGILWLISNPLNRS